MITFKILNDGYNFSSPYSNPSECNMIHVKFYLYPAIYPVSLLSVWSYYELSGRVETIENSLNMNDYVQAFCNEEKYHWSPYD